MSKKKTKLFITGMMEILHIYFIIFQTLCNALFPFILRMCFTFLRIILQNMASLTSSVLSLVFIGSSNL